MKKLLIIGGVGLALGFIGFFYKTPSTKKYAEPDSRPYFLRW